MPTTTKVLASPAAVLPGTVARVVKRGDRAVSERWDPDAGAWVEGSTVAEVLWSPPASPALLARLGIPS